MTVFLLPIIWFFFISVIIMCIATGIFYLCFLRKDLYHFPFAPWGRYPASAAKAIVLGISIGWFCLIIDGILFCPGFGFVILFVALIFFHLRSRDYPLYPSEFMKNPPVQQTIVPIHGPPIHLAKEKYYCGNCGSRLHWYVCQECGSIQNPGGDVTGRDIE
jgi:hypothetical protein